MTRRRAAGPGKAGAATLAAAMETMHAAGGRSLPPVPRSGNGAEGRGDPAQEFVSRLRGAAPHFAAAAGAQSAVVTEAVPPARHRRSRCRVVLRYADGHQSDLTFLGPAGRPVADADPRFDASIQRWLGDGQRREDGWIVPDDDAPDGVAVDVTAWVAAR